MMTSKFQVLAMVGVAGLSGLCSQPVGSADVQKQLPSSSGESTSSLGLDVFGLSLHFNRSEGFNEVNPGVGLRYTFWRPAPKWEVFGDSSIYYDSRRHWAKYVAIGASYPLSESWSIGVALAYGQSQTYHHGTPFFAPVPGLAFIYHGVAINTVLLPSEKSNAKIQGLGFFLTIPLGHRN